MLTARRVAPTPWLYAGAAAVVLFLFTLRAGWSGQLTDAGLAPFSRMIDGTAARPFVHRMLLPSIARGLHALVPGPLRDAIERAVRGHPVLAGRLHWTTAHASEVVIALLLAFGCFLAFAFVLRRLVQALPDAPEGASRWAPVVALLALPAVFLPGSVHLYDPATLLFFALGLLMLTERRRIGYYAVFVLACVNRETAILLTGLFLLRERRHLMPSRLALHGLAQAVLWAGLQAGIHARHAGNPGHEAQLLFPRNLRLLIEPRSGIGFWVLLVLAATLVVPGWNRKPRFLRQALLVTLLPVGLATFLAGLPTEMRDYLEAYPAIVLLALPTAVAWLTSRGSPPGSWRSPRGERPKPASAPQAESPLRPAGNSAS
jgi:hypothetical protein